MVSAGCSACAWPRKAPAWCWLPAASTSWRRCKQEVEAKGAEAIVIPCDVRELEQVKQCVDRAMAHYGNIDMLVNNAGYGNHHPFIDWPLEDIENLVRVNYFGSVYFTKLLLPQMIAMKNGCIVFIAPSRANCRRPMSRPTAPPSTPWSAWPARSAWRWKTMACT